MLISTEETIHAMTTADSTMTNSVIMSTETSSSVLVSTTSSTISNTLCSAPNVIIEQQYLKQNPKQIFRSKLLNFATKTYFSCNETYIQTYKWFINRIDLSPILSMDISSNPSSYSSELVIQSNTLDYGMYEIQFQVDITMEDVIFNSTMAKTYVQIIPSGLVVYPFKNGVSNIKIGSQQSLILNPILNSFDFDNLVDISSLKFKFYCKTIHLNSSVMENNNNLNLLMYKMNNTLQMTSNQTCFASNSKSIS